MASQAAAKPETKSTVPSIAILRQTPASKTSTISRPSGLPKALPRTLPSANKTTPVEAPKSGLQFQSVLGETLEPTSTLEKKESNVERDRCPSCEREFTTRTLAQNGGVCGRCSKATTTPTKSKEKGECTNCKKEFTLKTLEKCKGVCGKCNTKLQGGGAPSASSTTKKTVEKAMCSGSCGKEYTQKTLEKHGGMCNRCMSKSTGGRVVPARISPLFSDPNKNMGSILSHMEAMKGKANT